MTLMKYRVGGVSLAIDTLDISNGSPVPWYDAFASENLGEPDIAVEPEPEWANDGSLDVQIRRALSLKLPRIGGLLLHAALLATPVGAVVLAGDSNAGKSTAARQLGGICDELTVVRIREGQVRAFSTPYWSGQPFDGTCERIICLGRGSDPMVERLHGSRALNGLSRHVIRYERRLVTDFAILEVMAAI